MTMTTDEPHTTSSPNGDLADSSRQGSAGNQDDRQQQPQQSGEDCGTAAGGDNGMASKLKRTACVLCRKRKLRCDGVRPSCGNCSRLRHDCHYDEVRKKSGPKRGYVKALEARLAQVETMLKSQDGAEVDGANAQASNQAGSSAQVPHMPFDHRGLEKMGSAMETGTPMPRMGQQPASQRKASDDAMMSVQETFSWDMIALGLEEPLPAPEVASELIELYFSRVHPSMPMIHKPRFYAAMDLPPQMRPPIALRYAMWALAAGTTDKYEGIQEHFYERARKYLQLDEMRGHGENIITLSHCQAWVLVAMHEFKNMFFPRAWMSTGRAIRLAQMLSLHRQDRIGLDVKQCLPPPKDWTEREERRRTFWLCFWCDRCSSIGTGWPMTIEEDDIMSNLPAPEEAYQNSRLQRTSTLQEALESKVADFSPFSGSIVMATLFGRNLTHLHRPGPDEREHDLNGIFWERHRHIDSILLNISLTLPDSLRVPAGLPDPNVIFLNMCIHTSAICLHQAAIFKAEKHRLPGHVSAQSKIRCLTAASEIVAIMRAICHLDLTSMNPFMAFCLYVAARVFVQYLKARPSDQSIQNSLHFILAAMHAIKRKNPLTESFLAQLEVDLEGAGLQAPNYVLNLEAFRLGPDGSINPPPNTNANIMNNSAFPGPPFHVAQATNMNPNSSKNMPNILETTLPIGSQRPFVTDQNANSLLFEWTRIPQSSLGVPQPQVNPFEPGRATNKSSYSPTLQPVGQPGPISNGTARSQASASPHPTAAFTPSSTDEMMSKPDELQHHQSDFSRMSAKPAQHQGQSPGVFGGLTSNSGPNSNMDSFTPPMVDMQDNFQPMSTQLFGQSPGMQSASNFGTWDMNVNAMNLDSTGNSDMWTRMVEATMGDWNNDTNSNFS